MRSSKKIPNRWSLFFFVEVLKSIIYYSDSSSDVGVFFFVDIFKSVISDSDSLSFVVFFSVVNLLVVECLRLLVFLVVFLVWKMLKKKLSSEIFIINKIIVIRIQA